MYLLRVVIIVFLASSFAVTLNAQRKELNLVIDLALQGSETETRSVSGEGRVSLLIINKCPQGKYQVDTKLSSYSIPPLDLPDQSTKSAKSVESRSAPEDSCIKLLKEFNSAYDQLKDEVEEAKIPIRFAAAKRVIRESTCGDSIGRRNYDTALTELINTTKYEIEDPINLMKGQQLTVTITKNPGELNQQRWVVIFDTGERGRWLVTYGFSFPFLFAKDEEYFSKATGNDTFKITQKNNNDIVKYIPSVFFHWLASDDETNDMSWSGALGLNLDVTNFAVFAGVSMLYNQNIGITAGLAVHQVKRINQQYKDGDVLKENLSEDQLNTTTFRPNPFVSLTYRLGSNPFGNK